MEQLPPKKINEGKLQGIQMVIYMNHIFLIISNKIYVVGGQKICLSKRTYTSMRKNNNDFMLNALLI